MEKKQSTTLGVRTDEDNSSFINILIIADECARSTVVKLGLHHHYCHTILAHSIRKGFECLAAMSEIQVVISENTMPSSGGFELIVKIKAHPQWKRIPVNLVLEKPYPEIAQRAIELGCRHIIVKPFKAKLLLDKIDLALLENIFNMHYKRRVAVRGAISQQLHHRVAKLAVRAYKHVNRRLENENMIASTNERSQPIKGFLHRKSKRSYATVAEWLSKELRIIRRVKPHLKARHKIITLADWLSDEIRIMRRGTPYQKSSKKEDVKTKRTPQLEPPRDSVGTADTLQSHDTPPDRSDIPINVQYLILFRKAPYLFSKGMRKQIINTIHKD